LRATLLMRYYGAMPRGENMPTYLRAWWIVVIWMPGILFASSQDHGINWWHLGSEYKDAPALGWLFITFMIFIYGLVRAIKRPLSLYLETRSKDIRQQIEEARRAKVESEEKLRAYEEKLRSLDSEVDKMKAHFHEQAEAEKRERERVTKDLEARIVRETDDTIKANYERQKNRLAEEVIEKAMSMAHKVIAEEKRDHVDSALKGALVQDLSNLAKEVRQ
jgi:F-type H+-transporting ATPase subunit b